MGSNAPADAPWESGLRGARANLKPALALQAASVALAVAYYRAPAVHDAMSRLAAFRESTGYSFGIASTALFGGLLPFLYIHFSSSRGEGGPRYGWLQGGVLTAFWAYKGLEVAIWYQIQAHVFGTGHDFRTIAVKVLVDQFGYCVVLSAPLTTLVYDAVEAGPTWRASLAGALSPGWYRRRALPVLISNLGVWIPAVAVIYSLPTSLQLPLQNIVLCFYTLVVAHQTRGADPTYSANS